MTIPEVKFLLFYNKSYQVNVIDILVKMGGLHLKPPKFEHIFVAVITFSPFLLYKYF